VSSKQLFFPRHVRGRERWKYQCHQDIKANARREKYSGTKIVLGELYETQKLNLTDAAIQLAIWANEQEQMQYDLERIERICGRFV